MNEQRFSGRIWITNPDTDFLRMQNLGPQHEWLHLTEHQHLMAENERRIERLREAALKIVLAGPYVTQEQYDFQIDQLSKALDALQEDGK